jgi:hypothetical protein
MSYFAVPMQTTFPPQIARHYYSPGAIPMSGFGDDPTPTDPTGTPWWQQAANWAQQNLPSSPTAPTVPGAVDPTIPDPTQPQPAPAPAPNAPTVATSSANTLLVAGSIALVGVIGLVFLLKES